MIHNNKVYANADEKYVKATIVYVNTGSGGLELYHDEALTKPVYTDEIFDMFANGVIAKSGVKYYIPVALFNNALQCTDGQSSTAFNTTTRG